MLEKQNTDLNIPQPIVLLDLTSFTGRGARLYEEFIKKGIFPFTFNSLKTLNFFVNNGGTCDICLSFVSNVNTENIIHLNDMQNLALAKDKYACYETLVRAGMNLPSTYLSYSDDLGYPFVLKDRYGSLGEACYLVQSKQELIAILDEDAKLPNPHQFIYQKYQQKSYGQHYRLMILDNKCIAAMHISNNSGFKSNAHQGGKAVKYTPSQEEIDMCVNICKILGLKYAGIDLLIGDDGKKVFCEANGGAFFKELEAATQINVAEHIVNYLLNAYIQKIQK